MFPIDIDFSRLKEVLTYDPQAPMIFSSGIFLWLFAAFMIVYTLLQRKYTARILFVTLFSYYFYYKSSGTYFFLLALVTVCDFLLAQWMDRTEGRWKRKGLVTLSLGVNLGLLAYFKYTNFLGGVIASLMGGEFTALDIFLPVGISFFTFQSLSYTIDVYRKDIKPLTNILDYAFYVSFFPQLVAGPIVRARDFIPQIRKPLFVSQEMFGRGIFLILSGLFKKAIISDYISVNFVERIFDNPTLYSGLENLMGVYGYALQIYCDFSGYSDMAIGIALLLGFHFNLNFNSPYKACSVKELWQRWHMTLSRFFVQYVYIPLGGSRKGKLRTILNTFLVFFLSGLWHGANWTYVAWGTMQGLLVIWDNLGIVGVKGSDGNTSSKIYIPRWLGWIFTFGFFNFSLYFFRSESMADAFQMFRNIFAFKNTGYIYKVAAKLDIPEFYLMKQIINLTRPNLLQYAFLVLFIVLLLVSALILTRKNAVWIAENHPLNSKLSFFVTIIFVWSVISFSQVSTFIYFNF